MSTIQYQIHVKQKNEAVTPIELFTNYIQYVHMFMFTNSTSYLHFGACKISVKKY